jgi:hypothetical protein
MSSNQKRNLEKSLRAGLKTDLLFLRFGLIENPDEKNQPQFLLVGCRRLCE